MMRFKHKRIEDKAHLQFIRELRCCICQLPGVDPAHIRFSDARVAKANPGVGQKPDDAWTTPLCRKHHDEQHNYGDELGWWQKQGIDPILLSMALYRVSGDHEAGEQIVACATHKFECAA
jgi:hypothetical protein